MQNKTTRITNSIQRFGSFIVHCVLQVDRFKRSKKKKRNRTEPNEHTHYYQNGMEMAYVETR